MVLREEEGSVREVIVDLIQFMFGDKVECCRNIESRKNVGDCD